MHTSLASGPFSAVRVRNGIRDMVRENVKSKVQMIKVSENKTVTVQALQKLR